MTCKKCEECRRNGESFCIYCGEILAQDKKEGCPGCEECRRNGNQFCIYCGSKLTDERTAGCAKCEECRQNGDSFCIYCGTKLTDAQPEECTRCEECRSSGYAHCIYCGRPLQNVPVPQKEEPSHMKVGFAVGTVSAFLILLLILFEYGVATKGFPDVFSHLANATSTIILIIPQVYTVCSISGPALQAYYVFIFAMVTISLFLFIYKAVTPIRRLINNGKDNEPIKHTAFFEVAVLFSALYLVEMIFSQILSAFGQDVGSLPEKETWQWMYSLLEASVWEEIITRVLYLGIPMLIIALFLKKKEHPYWKYIFGGFGLSKTAIIFILFSSIMFGAGHLTNWAVWKFFPTFLSGLIMAYLFTKYGLYASIMYHFLTDYIQAESWAIGSDDMIVTALLLLTLMIACAPYVVVYIYRSYRYLKDTFGSPK